MFQSAVLSYIRTMFTYVPAWHWAVIGILSLAVSLVFLIRKSFSAYSSVVIGATVLIGLFLLEEAVVIRCCDILHHASGIDLIAEHNRFFHGNVWVWTQICSNFAAFIPFGFFLSEFLASAKWSSIGRRLGLATLAGFGLSLCIECLQLLLRVGFFELTDLVMNTLGAFVGSLISAGLRKLLGERSHALSALTD